MKLVSPISQITELLTETKLQSKAIAKQIAILREFEIKHPHEFFDLTGFKNIHHLEDHYNEVINVINKWKNEIIILCKTIKNLQIKNKSGAHELAVIHKKLSDYNRELTNYSSALKTVYSHEKSHLSNKLRQST